MIRFLVVVSLLLASLAPLGAGEIPMDRLNRYAADMVARSRLAVGYPINQNIDLKEFYEWYLASGLHGVSLNNVGNPQKESTLHTNSHDFENEVIEFFAPLYGFDLRESWGIVTFSGTDGNNHGVYFGVKDLLARTKKRPVLYVSEQAHYSIKKLGDLQNLEMKLIPTDRMGRMDTAAFAKVLNPKKPALIVIAMGTTFKGAIDDQEAIDKILKKKKPIAVYRHLDAALFGGYLPFTAERGMVDRRRIHFDSVAVSGHKFFGFDEPMGIFITTKAVLERQNPFKVAYLNDAVPTITCSRSGLAALKFWWKVKRTGREGFAAQAAAIIANAAYLKANLDEMGYPAWLNPYSNTVFFKRPGKWIMDKWDLAPDEDPRLGGPLAHEIIMQHETRETIDRFIEDLKKDIAGQKGGNPG